MAETFANNATGVLNATITSGATSLVLNSGQGAAFPSTGNFRILIESEIIIVGARSGDTLSSLTRGAEGTAAAGHNAGTTVTHILTKAALETLLQTTLVDAKGDLYVATADDTVARLAVGANGNVLTADSTQSTGVKWASGGAWTSYTPQLTATTTNPTLGTGPTQTGGYFQLGKLVVIRAQIIFGTGMTAGSGTYNISLPVNALIGTWNNHGQAYLVDASSGNIAIPQARVSSATTVDLAYPGTMPVGAVTAVTHAAPWAWAASDQINLMFTYEAA